MQHLLLAILDGQFEPVKAHAISVLKSRSFWVVIQHNLQLVGASRVIK